MGLFVYERILFLFLGYERRQEWVQFEFNSVQNRFVVRVEFFIGIVDVTCGDECLK